MCEEDEDSNILLESAKVMNIFAIVSMLYIKLSNI